MAEHKGKILVVDDDPTLLPMLVDTLSSIGYQSVAAADGVEALDLLKEGDRDSFDLMITDIKMPNVDGLSLLKRVRRHYPNLPVLFITGVASQEVIARASPDGFLAKPFRISLLEGLIEKTLAAKRGNRQPEQPRKVLVNMPEDDLRDMLSEALSCSNYLPFAVAGGDEALQELERGKFDVMITGVEKSFADSPANAGRIRDKYPTLPMLLVSSSYSPDEINRLNEQMEFSGFVRQPFRVGELIELLDRTVAHPIGRSN